MKVEEDYETALKVDVFCECGTQVQNRNLDQHRRSMIHKLRLAKATHLAFKGGSTGLWQCDCGEYVTFLNRRQHCEGRRHTIRMGNVAKGAETCEICSLPYLGLLAIHLKNYEHHKNLIRKRRFAYQTLEVEQVSTILSSKIKICTQINHLLKEVILQTQADI
jgi:hypothetical protein